jgi:tetratricopeptide (TPR) repeat protein
VGAAGPCSDGARFLLGRSARCRSPARIALLAILAGCLCAPGSSAAQSEASPEELAKLQAEVEELHQQGRYSEAIPLATRVLETEEKTLGPEHPDVARSLDNLASLHQATGDYAQAVLLYERSLAIQENALAPEEGIATALSNLAAVYQDAGQYRRAQPLYERSLAIREAVLGPEHPEVATTLDHLAGVYESQGDYQRALRLTERSLAIREKALDREHRAAALDEQAAALRARKRLLLERSLTIQEEALGREHRDLAAPLSNLAELYLYEGDHARAAALYERSLAIWQRALGPEHRAVTTTLSNLAVVAWAEGDLDGALRFFERAARIDEKWRAAMLSRGSERKAQEYLADSGGHLDALLSLARMAPQDARAIQITLTEVLRTKGRILEAAGRDGSPAARRRARRQGAPRCPGIQARAARTG